MRYNAPVVVLLANEVRRVLYNEGCVCVSASVCVRGYLYIGYIHTYTDGDSRQQSVIGQFS